MKKAIAILMAILMFLAIAAACGNSGGGAAPAPAPSVNPGAGPSPSPTLNPGSSPSVNPGGGASPDSGEAIVVPPDIELTAGGTVIAGNPNSGNYTTMSTNGPVYVQEFEPTYVQPKIPGTVYIYSNSFERLDPAFLSQAERGWTENVYESLFARSQDGTGEFLPLLATDWYYDAEGNFHAILREGVKFHDGSGRIMTAEDVLYSIERVVNSPASPASAGMQGVDIDNSYAENDYHVVIKFKAPVGAFMKYMSSVWLGIVNKEFFEEVGPDFDFWEKSAGTGAYYIVETVTGISQTFKRFDEYWGGKPVMDTIIIRRGDTTVMGIDMENGDFDIALQSTTESIRRVLEGTAKGIDYLLLSSYRNFRLQPTMHPETKPFSDYRVREAFSLGINREEVVLAVYGSSDLGRPADRQMIDGIDVGVLEYNPDKAREIMSSLGYGPNNPCVVELIVNNAQESIDIAEAIQGMVNECYFDFRPNFVTSGMTEGIASREFPSKWDGALSQGKIEIDAEIYFANCDAYGKEVGEYSAMLANDDPEFARLFRLLPVTTDQVERNKIIDQINILYQENLYFVPILLNYQPTLVQNYLKNVVFRDGMGILWKYLEYKDWVN